MVEFRKKTLVFLIITLLICLTITDSQLLTQRTSLENDIEFRDAFEFARDFVEPKIESSLQRAEKVYCEVKEQEIWIFDWMTTNHALVEVELDAGSFDILSYFDGSIITKSSEVSNEISEREVWRTAMDFLHNLLRIQELPEGAVFEDIKKTAYGWDLIWKHWYNGVPVNNDYFTISVESTGNEVYSYSKTWNLVNIDTNPSLNVPEAMDILFLDTIENKKIIDSTAYLSIVLTEHSEVHLAWVISVDFGEKSSEIYWIDADNGMILFKDIMMIGWRQDVYVYDNDWFGGGETQQHAYSAYRKLHSASSEGLCTYSKDASSHTELYFLTLDKVYYHMGHGNYITTGGEKHSVIMTPDGNIAPDDVLTKNLSQTKLAYIATCLSFGGTAPVGGLPEMDYSIAQAFLDAGAQCVFGWVGEVSKRRNWIFSDYFFDKAVNSYNMLSCYEYAKLKSQVTNCKIDGDTDVFLTENDVEDSYPGTLLGSGYDIWLQKNCEGLWGENYLDVDWFKLYVDGTRSINIFVAPIDSELDVAFEVYRYPSVFVRSRDVYGQGHQESCSIVDSSGWYYIKIYGGSQNSVHGGCYDLNIWISS